jgi:hypothetical protein
MLKESDAPEYWRKRAEESGKAAVGFMATNLSAQNEQYREKENFVLKNIHTSIYTVDYGCGVGRWAKHWSIDKYLGVDMTKSLLDIAQGENPSHSFSHLSSPFLTERLDNVEQVFTSTVLQHCDDSLVLKIMESWAKFIPHLKSVCLYELGNNSKKHHVGGRSHWEYADMVKKAGIFSFLQYSASHCVHKELHTITRIQVM